MRQTKVWSYEKPITARIYLRIERTTARGWREKMQMAARDVTSARHLPPTS